MALSIGTRGVVLLLVAALLLLSIGGLVFFRDAVLSALATRSMARRGLLCGKVVLHVPLALPPSPVVMEATRCEVAEGPLAAVELKAPLFIHLEGFQVGSIRCASAEVHLRPRAPREVALNALGDLTRLVGLEQAALDLLFDTAALSIQPAPPLRVTELLVRRAGKLVISFQDLELTSSDAGHLRAGRRAGRGAAAAEGHPHRGGGHLRRRRAPEGQGGPRPHRRQPAQRRVQRRRRLRKPGQVSRDGIGRALQPVDPGHQPSADGARTSSGAMAAA
jgi:hypothetical protein